MDIKNKNFEIEFSLSDHGLGLLQHSNSVTTKLSTKGFGYTLHDYYALKDEIDRLSVVLIDMKVMYNGELRTKSMETKLKEYKNKLYKATGEWSDSESEDE